MNAQSSKLSSLALLLFARAYVLTREQLAYVHTSDIHHSWSPVFTLIVHSLAVALGQHAQDEEEGEANQLLNQLNIVVHSSSEATACFIK